MKNVGKEIIHSLAILFCSQIHNKFTLILKIRKKVEARGF